MMIDALLLLLSMLKSNHECKDLQGVGSSGLGLVWFGSVKLSVRSRIHLPRMRQLRSTLIRSLTHSLTHPQ